MELIVVNILPVSACPCTLDIQCHSWDRPTWKPNFVSNASTLNNLNLKNDFVVSETGILRLVARSMLFLWATGDSWDICRAVKLGSWRWKLTIRYTSRVRMSIWSYKNANKHVTVRNRENALWWNYKTSSVCGLPFYWFFKEAFTCLVSG